MQANLTIKGHVQGVLFRSDGRKRAIEEGLTGWIKNEPNGTVSVCAQGKKRDIESFIDWCRKGPPLAMVEEIRIQWIPEPKESFDSFQILNHQRA